MPILSLALTPVHFNFRSFELETSMERNGTARPLTFEGHTIPLKMVAPGRRSMKTYPATTVTLVVLTNILLAFSAFARDHSALNGTRTLVPTQSDFACQSVVQTGTVTVADRQGKIA